MASSYRFLIAVLSFAILLGFGIACDSGDDDDDDNNDDDGQCEQFCQRVAECDVADELGIDNMEQCLTICEENADLVDCILEAENCSEVSQCVEEGDDDDDDAYSCDDAGYPVRDFEDAQDDDSLYAVAADFTVPTLKGDWNFQENWTGCENYLFIQDIPSQTRGWDVPLWDRDVEDLLNKLPDNTQVFFCSTSFDNDVREEALADLKETIDDYIAEQPPTTQDRWGQRIHYITDGAKELDGWLGDLMLVPGWGAGIDRFQRIRYIGSYADYRRYDSGQGWFAPNISMAANEAIYYNFEALREEGLDAADATIIPVFTDEEISDPGWEGVRGYADVELPSQSAMAGFDTLEFDLYLGCVGDGEYGDCPAWDYLVYLYLCDEDNPDQCDTEFGRWITTYHREGRWVHDASGLLPLIASGGTRRLAFYTTQAYEVTLNLRLSDSSKPDRPEEASFLFSGGGFGPEYNDNFDPLDVYVPADAQKVELATVITGHGGATPGNCAEFCNTTHHFYVNGTEYMRDFDDTIGDNEACMDQVTEGTVPNQYGTWWYGRSGWCPGKEVPIVMTDVTDSILLGQTNQIDYEGFYQGEPYPSGGANIRMKSWLVVSK